MQNDWTRFQTRDYSKISTVLLAEFDGSLSIVLSHIPMLAKLYTG